MPDAPEGSVTNLDSNWKLSDLGAHDAILCRNNAPLIKVAFRLVKAQIPCKYLGKNLKENLEGLIKRISASTPEAFMSRLATYCDREIRRLRAKHKNHAAANVEDMCECLATIVRQSQTMAEVSATIEKIFGTAGVTLSTIHKAKGLEWDTVFILNRNLIPSPYYRTQVALRQEANLLHVAITRTKTHLKYISA